MRRSTSRRLTGRWLAALMALATSGVVASSSAQAAGCATGHAPRRSSATYLDVMEMLAADGGLADPRGPAPVDRPRPCTGAFCSGLPAAPYSTSPDSSPGFDQWAIATPPVPPTEPTTIARPRDESALRAVRQVDPIFHPPRRRAATVSL